MRLLEIFSGATVQATGARAASCSLIIDVEIGGTTAAICGNTRNIMRNRIGFVPHIHGYFRVFPHNGKKIFSRGAAGVRILSGIPGRPGPKIILALSPDGH
jgi:hypothetical protein